MGIYPTTEFEEETTMKYNMNFVMETNAMTMSFIAGLELSGVKVSNRNGVWSAIGLAEEDRNFIEQHAQRFWGW